ncbi:glycosyltransferase family 39 protein [Patescibacteria group bacterium]|nr:glycosyltransferase family 39 protein [Patescibacteria group bacterium]
MQTVFNQSIWGDEGFSAILSMKSLPEIIKIIATDTSPPLWNIAEYIAFQIFGTGEVVIRSLALIFFLGAIFFTYKIGALLWNKKTGILAALLTFLNPFFFTYAFEGRMYSIMALGVVASMYFFLKITRSKKASKADLIGYVIGTLWAMYSHHFAIFTVFVQGLWFLYELIRGNKQSLRLHQKKVAVQIFKGFVFVGIGYLPWLVPLYNQTKMVGGGFWLGTPTAKDLAKLFGEYIAVGIKHKFAFPALYVALMTFLFRDWRKKIKDTLFLASWFLGPILITWIVSQFFQSIFFNRYLLYAIPGAMLILASNKRKMSCVLISVLVILFAVIDFHYFTNPVKRPFRELSFYVKQTMQEGDFLINWNAGSHHLWETKYYDIPAPIYISPDGGDLPYFVGTALMEEADVVREIPEGTLRVGIVTSGSLDEIDLPGYTEGERKQLRDLNFVWYLQTNTK